MIMSLTKNDGVFYMRQHFERGSDEVSEELSCCFVSCRLKVKSGKRR